MTPSSLRMSLPSQLNLDIIVVDATPFASEWAVWATGAVKTWSMTVELNQDYDIGEIDDQLFPLLGEDSGRGSQTQVRGRQ